ncbi:MAG: hypothetical protein LBJ13_02770 [Puniceicoccales bacterium]|nr:hypothetical protein [Puniceicoccales bacterium]
MDLIKQGVALRKVVTDDALIHSANESLGQIEESLRKMNDSTAPLSADAQSELTAKYSELKAQIGELGSCAKPEEQKSLQTLKDDLASQKDILNKAKEGGILEEANRMKMLAAVQEAGRLLLDKLNPSSRGGGGMLDVIAAHMKARREGVQPDDPTESGQESSSTAW